MKSSLMEEVLNSDNYEKYIDKVLNIFRLSSKQSSILFDVEMEENQVMITLSIVNQEGEKQEFNDTILKRDEQFYHSFLLVLVKKIEEMGVVQTKDIIPSEKDSFVVFRMITVNNDLFTINGLTQEEADELLNLSDKKNSEEESVLSFPTSNEGKGNLGILLFIIGVLVIAFLFIVNILG